MLRRSRSFLVLAAAALALLCGCSAPSGPPPTPPLPPTQASATPPAPPAETPVAPADGPPVARREDVADVLHGVRVADPYRWLENATSTETREWLATFDAHTRRRLDALPGRAALEARLRELSYVEHVSPPIRRGARHFFTRRPADREKAIYYWREGPKGEPRVLLDPNALSPDGSVAVKGVWVSYDGVRAAYKLSKNNADEATMFVMDVATGKVSDVDVIEGAKYASASWTPDGGGFYYVRLPVDASIPIAERPGYAQIYFHRLGADPKSDELVHDKTGDPRMFIDAELSRDGRYLFVYKHYGWTKGDVLFKDLRRHRDWVPFAVGKEAKYAVTAWQDRFYVHTNEDAARWRVFKVDPRKPERAHWREIVPEHPQAFLEDVRVLGGQLVLHYLENASSTVRIADLEGRGARTLALPGIGSVEGPIGNPEDDTAHYGFSSFTAPTTVFRTSVRRGTSEEVFRLDVPVDPTPYAVEQVFFPSKDGTRISMFLVHRKDRKRDGETPLLLTGYGGFNQNITPGFVATRFAWLDRGGAYAMPNLRGGGEYGEAWHQAGMLTRKQNVFDDFIAAAEYLVKGGYTRPDRLAISGGSNGGLLVGAAMTQRPDLFGAVVCSVPLLDMVRYHLFGSGKTWTSEYGSADDPAHFEALYAYSPYHRLVPGTRYPAFLMLTADSDDRVDPMHARKFAAALLHARAGDAPVLLRLETKSGHGGGDMVKKEVARLVDIYAFLFDRFGMK
jgi:prolyl oligopeptidase